MRVGQAAADRQTDRGAERPAGGVEVPGSIAPQYRICTVMMDGRVATDRPLAVATEAEAIARTWEFLDDHPIIELWCDAQRLVQLDQSILRAAMR